MKYFFLLFTLLSSLYSFAQNKYQSLLWEITGNGLSKPSYVFGTMHVSNKLAFNLSDSFYHAIRNVDAVALELNPETWQEEMVKMDRIKENYSAYVTPIGNDYLTINSFRIQDFVPTLRQALRTEPSTVNSLLYRSYKSREDFEEDTFLDLYIYQTGRKLGKKAAGLEDYYASEKLILEAYGDMAREKKKRIVDLEAQVIRNILEQVQAAYRNGDLDLLDSLDNLMERSDAFREKFLYRRNEIQADAIDSIIRTTSLFAGVGAAHLPGKRGVVELLRAKGYNVRPVKMTDRDAKQKAGIDKLTVPVKLIKQSTPDGLISFEAPGLLYKSDNVNGASRWQFADMNNGSYYMITRLKTYAFIRGINKEGVIEKIDSLLYENIRGNILDRKRVNDLYPGIDLKAKTRRGDVQRYQIRITPHEIIIIKASGPGEYMEGDEGDRFFRSIVFNNAQPVQNFSYGNLKILKQVIPHTFQNDLEGRWEFESTDSIGNSILVIRKSMVNFDHLDEDTFYLSMMKHSFFNPAIFLKEKEDRFKNVYGRSGMESEIYAHDSAVIKVLYLLNGPDYYAVVVKGEGKPSDIISFVNSESKKSEYVDTIIKVSVKHEIMPDVDQSLRAIVENNAQAAFNGENSTGYFSYWPRPRFAVFGDDTTGRIMIKAQEFPVYFSIRDSVRYWENEMKNLVEKNDLEISSVKDIYTSSHRGKVVMLSDTGSSRVIKKAILLNGNQKYEITALTDSGSRSNSFENFLQSFKPSSPSTNIYDSKLPAFFSDLTGSDSLTRARARQSIKSNYYGPEGLPLIMQALNKISLSDRDYFEIKSSLINELGFINDHSGSVVTALENLYLAVKDTIMFQNEVIKALARQKTSESFRVLKEFMVDDPPIFENAYEYHSLFRNFSDSLKLSEKLYPDLLKLLPLTEYKSHVFDLLATLQDSGFVMQKKYQEFLPQILLEARVSIKKLRHRDNRIREKELESREEPGRIFNTSGNDDLFSQAVLLLPFYDKNIQVKEFFKETVESLDPIIKINGVVLLLRAGKPVPDSILQSIAKDERYRSYFYSKLDKYNLEGKFPSRYKEQEGIARSFLLMENSFDKMDSLELMMKIPATFQNNSGVVYLYRYRIQKGHEWKIGVSGLQPQDSNIIVVNPAFVSLTQTRINPAKDIKSQLFDELRKMIILSHRSGRNFFDSNEAYEMFD